MRAVVRCSYSHSVAFLAMQVLENVKEVRGIALNLLGVLTDVLGLLFRCGQSSLRARTKNL